MELAVQNTVITSGITKAEISFKAKSFIDSILEKGGELEVAEALSAAEAFIKEVKSDARLKDAIRVEIEKFGKSHTTANGSKLELAEAGVSYDYSQCNDPEYARLESESAEIGLMLKERQKMLQAVPLSGMDILNEETGEVYKIYPPSRTSTSSYKVTLKK